MLSASDARACSSARANNSLGCYREEPFAEAIKKAAERGDTSLIYIAEDRNEWDAMTYVNRARQKGYEASIIGRILEGNYVIKIDW
jgi:succinyl-CoA synthetase alpha subunit